jgi:N-acetylneuraminic acid mutarotase
MPMTSFIRRTLMALAAGLLALPLSVSAQAPGQWLKTKFAPLPEPAEEYWSAAANGKFYLFGGSPVRTADRTFLPGRVLEYDPSTDKWTSKKQMPRPTEHMAVTEYQGKIYLFGGAGPENPGEAGPSNYQFNYSWEYDPANDSWKSLAPMPTRRNGAAAVAVGGKIYVIGGSGLAPGAQNPSSPAALRVLDTNEAYDPATNTWETRGAMPTPRHHVAIGAVGGKIYVIGGLTGAATIGNYVANATSVVEEYDPATDRWRAMSKMPTARSGQGWATYQGRIYVVGGEIRNYELDAVLHAFEEFDPATNQWFQLPPLPLARHGINVAVFGNHLHVIGGHVAFDGTGGHSADSDVDEVFEFGGM